MSSNDFISKKPSKIWAWIPIVLILITAMAKILEFFGNLMIIAGWFNTSSPPIMPQPSVIEQFTIPSKGLHTVGLEKYKNGGTTFMIRNGDTMMMPMYFPGMPQ